MKNVEQQAILSAHRARQGFVKARTAQANQIRGLLSEFGIVIPQGINSIIKQVPEILEDGENGLPGTMGNLIEWLAENLKEIPGLGPITASAIVATMGDAREFKNGRQLAAWMGLVPKQNFSGGKQNLLGTSKRGDTYPRTLMIHGARAVIRFAENRAEPESWMRKLMGGHNKNVGRVKSG